MKNCQGWRRNFFRCTPIEFGRRYEAERVTRTICCDLGDRPDTVVSIRSFEIACAGSSSFEFGPLDQHTRQRTATLANGALSQASSYYAATGQLQGITVSGAAGTVHDLDYEYDGYGSRL